MNLIEGSIINKSTYSILFVILREELNEADEKALILR